MKKLMTFAAVLMTAALTQAASLQWNVDVMAYTGQPEANIGMPTFTLYLVNVGAPGLPTGISVDNGGNLILGGGMSLVDTASAGGGGVYASSETATTSVGANLAAVIYYASGNLWGVSGVQTALADPTDISGNTLLALSLSNGVDPWGYGFNALNANVGVVPEPTSFALLGLGAAALALRRRIRKA